MSATAESALGRNADTISEAPPQPSNVSSITKSKPRVLTLAQEEIVRAFTNDYDIEHDQIGFRGEDLEPIFDFDALSILALALTDFREISVEPGDFNAIGGVATATCGVVLSDNRLRGAYGHCVIGQVLHDGSEVTDLSMAMGVARARALRTGLRMAGFDPVRAHRAHRAHQGENLPFSPPEETDQRTKDLRQIHALAEELLWVKDGDESEYRRQINTLYPGINSAGDMTDQQRSQFIAIMGGLQKARAQAAATFRP